MPHPRVRIIALAVLLIPVAGARAEAAGDPATGRVRYVTDGDTFRLESGGRIRIAGIDAPEIHADQARCSREIGRGLTAKAIAERLLDGR
jgi:endonuclease YncB( thermonuclease family)